MQRRLTLRGLRGYAVARTFFAPTTLDRAIDRLVFVQADPIRAPARAQDLLLRHRVEGYRAGDLDRRYAELSVEEEHFVNYGYLPRAHVALLHPRGERRPWSQATSRLAALVLEFVRERGEAHPRDVDPHFARGTVTNAWGGTSNATTRLLEGMHYRGLLRVTRRERGIRIYALSTEAPQSREAPLERAKALLDLAIRTYAPLPSASLGPLVTRLRYAAPQLRRQLGMAMKEARRTLPHANVDGVEWLWPEGEDPLAISAAPRPARVRLLAPFDPLVWDRRRFELFWGWAYRFEAYTPVAKRKLGYYAMPLLRRDDVVGWGNLAMRKGELVADLGYVTGRAPADRGFKRELEAELARMRAFLEG